MAIKKTVSALVDCWYQPTGSKHFVHRIEQVEIALATKTSACAHEDTLYLECAPLWRDEISVHRTTLIRPDTIGGET